MSYRRTRRVVAFNVGVGLVFVSLPLPWARIAGRTRSGPDFADLLLRLPEIPGLGAHLEVVALLWYAIPLLALGAWLTQFRAWPPDLDRLSVVVSALLVVVIGLLMAWLAVRGVGFPQAGGMVASVGALLMLGMALAAGRRPLAPAEPE